MIYATLKTLHVLSIVIWVGGMVFAHFFLRPAVTQLEPPMRLRLMHDVLGRFFKAVLAVSLLTLATGLWMLGRVAKQVVQSRGQFQMPLAWAVMAVLGWRNGGLMKPQSRDRNAPSSLVETLDPAGATLSHRRIHS